MSLETMAAQGAKEGAEKTARLFETALKKAWSILDAATEKQRPSEFLSPKAVSAIQGKVES